MLLTASLALSFGITQARTNAEMAMVTVDMKPVVSVDKSPSIFPESASFYNAIPVVSNVIGFAKRHLLIRYRLGDTTPKGGDCSGFTRFCFSKFGIDPPHSSVVQGVVTQRVDRE